MAVSANWLHSPSRLCHREGAFTQFTFQNGQESRKWLTIQICHVLNAWEAKKPLYGTKNLSKGAKTRVRVLADIQNFALRAHCVHGIPPICTPRAHLVQYSLITMFPSPRPQRPSTLHPTPHPNVTPADIHLQLHVRRPVRRRDGHVVLPRVALHDAAAVGGRRPHNPLEQPGLQLPRHLDKTEGGGVGGSQRTHRLHNHPCFFSHSFQSFF